MSGGGMEIQARCPKCGEHLNIKVPLDGIRVEDTEGRRSEGRGPRSFFPPMRMHGDTLRVGDEESPQPETEIETKDEE